MDVKQDLQGLQKALFDFSKRNQFIHVKVTDLWFSNQDAVDSKKIEKLYLKSAHYWKEYGLETALNVAVFIKWSPPVSADQTNRVYYCSPLFYKPCTIKRNRKIETTYSIRLNEEKYQVNPVIQHYFQGLFECELPSELEDLEAGIELIKTTFQQDGANKNTEIELVTDFDETETWQLIVKESVGIFNYKKSALGADYQEIIKDPNAQLVQLLTGERADLEELEFPEVPTISFLDQSQRAVIKRALHENTVIQGPPGTGKSHTIVALIAAFLAEGKKVLFVSEKRSALEVVAKRLEKRGLGDLIAYFNTQKDQKKVFYQKLRKTWELLGKNDFDSFTRTPKSLQHDYGLLDVYPSKLIDYRPEIEGNLADLIDLLVSSGYDPKALHCIGNVPVYAEWKNALPFLSTVENQLLEAFHVDCMGDAIFTAFNSVVFSESNVMLNLEKRLNDLKETLVHIRQIQKDFDLNDDFDAFTKLAITASVLKMVDKVQMDVLNEESKKHKSFNTVSKKYNLLKAKLQQAVLANQKWTRKPSMGEITELLDLLAQVNQSKSQSLFRRLKRNPAKLKTAFSDFHAGISNHTKIKLLESLKLEWRLKGELDEVLVQLKHDFNIHEPDQEINLIFNLRSKLNDVSQNEYVRILEHSNAAELIQQLSEIHPEILKFSAQNRYLFLENDTVSLNRLELKLTDLKAQLPLINHWLTELKTYFGLHPSIRNFIKQNPWKLKQLDAAVAYANLLAETRFETRFNQLSGQALEEAGINYKLHEKEVHQNVIQLILDQITGEYQMAERLLSKPGFKLNTDQKEKKKLYKLQKRTILHEIGKQQRHLSVKSFFSETKEHLLSIQPLWMMNPLTVSEFLPCEKDLFDVVIFDESSQIPLEDSVPSIYRTKQVVVVGDSRQMPPPSFFTNREETKTILDQAEHVFASEMLRWHYRSKHPDLIRFSNLEFYDGNLICLPPQAAAKPIELKWVDGKYESGVNLVEAEAIAVYCREKIQHARKKILIIAFSQSQEMAIRSALLKVQLDDHALITVRNLENAQGIESDYVLISIGYGKDEEGNFRLNFGPVNQVNGANRLNVLFTRAIEKMVIFTSVRSDEFGFSENRGVQVLKDFLQFAERLQVPKNGDIFLTHSQHWIHEILLANALKFNYYPAGNGLGINSYVQHESRKILLLDPGVGEQEINDLPSILSVLSGQFAAVKIILSLDIWQNPTRTKQDVLDFFME